MRKILLILFSLLLTSNICFADETWEHVGDVKEFKVSVEKNSLKTTTVDSQNILELMIKMENIQSNAYFGSIRTPITEVSGQHNGHIRTP